MSIQKKLGLREQAEQKLLQRLASLDQQPSEDIKSLIHELNVHQIELELQNEELRRIQQDLEAARDQYSDLYDFAPVGYITLSESRQIVAANLSFATMIGIGRSALINQSFTRFIIDDDQDLFYFCSRKLFEEGGTQQCELRLRHAGGPWFYAHLISDLVPSGLAKDMQARMIITDMTDFKEAEAALQKSEERFRKVFEEGPLGLYIADLDYHFTHVNAQLCRILNFTEAELVQKSLSDVVFPDDLENITQLCQMMLKGALPHFSVRKPGVNQTRRYLMG